MQYDDALLDNLRREGDPTADAVVEELAATGEIRAVSKVLRHLVDNDQPVPSELPASIAQWLGDTAKLPAWTDYPRLVRGADLVVDHGPQVAMILATASLPIGTGARSVKLKPARKLLGKPRKSFRVKVRVTATDAAGKRAVASRTVKVKVKRKRKHK